MMTATWLRRAALVLVVGSVGAFVGGCSSSSESDSGNGSDAGNQGTDAGNGGNDAGNQGMDAGNGGTDAGQDAGNGGTDAGNGNDAGNGSDAGQDAGTTVVLTVKNYFAWCDVSVGGMTASQSSQQTVNEVPGTTVPLSAAPIGGFMLGSNMWHGDTGDTGSGDPGTVDAGTSYTTVVVGSGPTCVWVCCPSTSNPTDCNVGNQCP